MQPIRPAGQTIIFIVVALLTLGIIMVTSADQQVSQDQQVSLHGILFSRAGVYAVFALGMMWLGTRLRVRALCGVPASLSAGGGAGCHAPDRSRSIGGTWLRAGLWCLKCPAFWLLLIALIGLVLVHFEQFDGESKGAKRWLRYEVGPIGLSFQPSELAKWSLVLVVAGYVAGQARSQMTSFIRGLLPILAIIGLTCLFIIVEDLGTAMLVGAVAGVLLVAAGMRWRHMFAMLIPATGVIYAAIMAEEYRLRRLTAFVRPYDDPDFTGYHMIQSMAAIQSGRITGRGLGYGVHKFGYLPEDTTDFLFAVVCEELGLFGAMLVVALYCALIIAALRIIVRQRELVCRLVGLGVVMTTGLQALINMMVVTGLAPTKGIALPLISAGGSGWVLTAFSLGLLVGMDRAEPGLRCDAGHAEGPSQQNCEPDERSSGPAGDPAIPVAQVPDRELVANHPSEATVAPSAG